MNRALMAAGGLTISLFTARETSADAVPPPPKDCPAGTHGVTGHAGPGLRTQPVLARSVRRDVQGWALLRRGRVRRRRGQPLRVQQLVRNGAPLRAAAQYDRLGRAQDPRKGGARGVRRERRLRGRRELQDALGVRRARSRRRRGGEGGRGRDRAGRRGRGDAGERKDRQRLRVSIGRVLARRRGRGARGGDRSDARREATAARGRSVVSGDWQSPRSALRASFRRGLRPRGRRCRRRSRRARLRARPRRRSRRGGRPRGKRASGTSPRSRG